MVQILIMSLKLATLGLLNFRNKGYNVIISAPGGTNQFVLRDCNYISDVIMWNKFNNASIFMKEVIITSILQGFDQKKHFFLRTGFGSSSIILDLH